MTGLFEYSIRHPRRVIWLAVVATAALAPGALRLTIRTDGHALVPTSAPEIALDKAIQDAFGVGDPIVVVVRSAHKDGVFNAATLALVRSLTERFGALEGVDEAGVTSLATEPGFRVYPGTLRFRPLLDPLPATPEQVRTVADDVRKIKLYTGTVVSRDESAAAILVDVPPDAARIPFYQLIQSIIAEEDVGLDEIRVIGAPVAESLLGTHILDDLGVPSAVIGHRIGREEDDEPIGWPTSLYELRTLVAQTVGLVPIALAVMATVFLVCFRGLAAVALPLIEVGACLTVVFSLMGIFGVPVYLTVAVLPIILTAIGVADEIHIFSRYMLALRDRPDEHHITLLTDTMREMWVPVAKTSFTTAIAFLAFALSPIGAVRAFGIFTAVGILFCLLWSLTVIPALLALIPPVHIVGRRTVAQTAGRGSGRAGWLSVAAARVVRWRWAVVAGALAVVLICPAGLRRLVVQDSWIDGFATQSEFHRATTWFNDQFLGTHLLLVRVSAAGEPLAGVVSAEYVDHHSVKLPGDLVEQPEDLLDFQLVLELSQEAIAAIPADQRGRRPTSWTSSVALARRDGDKMLIEMPLGDGSPKLALRTDGDELLTYRLTPNRLKSPDVLRRIGELESFIESRTACAVGGVIGTTDYVKTTNFMTKGQREEARRIPDTAKAVGHIWHNYGRIRGEKRLRQVVSKDYSQSLVTVFMTDANFVGTRRLMGEIRAYEKSHLTPHGLSLDFAGDVAVSQTLIAAIVSTQTRSLLVSMLGIFAVTAWMGRSLLWGCYCLLPCALAVLVNYAVMGLTGMPLGVATSMFAGMTLGIGVDYAIHLLHRCKHNRRAGDSLDDAIIGAVRVAGRAILIDAAAVALGFGVMILSQVPANARLGGLVVCTIVTCLLATLVVLPALIRIRPPAGIKEGALRS